MLRIDLCGGSSDNLLQSLHQQPCHVPNGTEPVLIAEPLFNLSLTSPADALHLPRNRAPS